MFQDRDAKLVPNSEQDPPTQTVFCTTAWDVPQNPMHYVLIHSQWEIETSNISKYITVCDILTI